MHNKLNVVLREIIMVLMLHPIPMLSASSSLGGNTRPCHIFSWSCQPSNPSDRFLAYFLLNDQDKACFYHPTVIMISHHCPVSFFSLHTTWPMVVLHPRCKERIYWWHQFLHSLMYTRIKGNYYEMKYILSTSTYTISLYKLFDKR